MTDEQDINTCALFQAFENEAKTATPVTFELDSDIGGKIERPIAHATYDRSLRATLHSELRKVGDHAPIESLEPANYRISIEGDK
jgi:hypothetical protein